MQSPINNFGLTYPPQKKKQKKKKKKMDFPIKQQQNMELPNLQLNILATKKKKRISNRKIK